MKLSNDPFAAVVGQPQAVERLRAAARQPVHAYLFLGPHGSGKRDAAAAFAAGVLAHAAGDDLAAAERHIALAAAWKHPDVVFFAPEGRTLRGDDAANLVIEASRSPVEGGRKIIVCDRFHTAEPGAAASLLKTIEEPAGPSMFVLLAEEVPPEHVTIASRCTIVDFGEVSEDLVVEWLVDQGIDHDLAVIAAQAARGDLHRARLLASDPGVAARRALWLDAPARLDGTGAAATAVVDELRAAIDRAQGPLDALHTEEAAELERQSEHFGVTATTRKDMTARHKREARRLRDDELRFGFAVLAARYRAEIDAGDAQPALAAIDALRDAADALLRNPNEALQLQRLFLRLPPLSA